MTSQLDPFFLCFRPDLHSGPAHPEALRAGEAGRPGQSPRQAGQLKQPWPFCTEILH